MVKVTCRTVRTTEEAHDDAHDLYDLWCDEPRDEVEGSYHECYEKRQLDDTSLVDGASGRSLLLRLLVGSGLTPDEDGAVWIVIHCLSIHIWRHARDSRAGTRCSEAQRARALAP